LITSPLFGWLAGKELLPKRFHSKDEADNLEVSWAVSVALDEVVPLHEVVKAKWQSLRKSRELTASYLSAADGIIDGLWGGRLDAEERHMVQNELGQPPAFCMPIYIVTVRTESHEEVVYVGKTISATRFIGGHAAAIKLHAPEFSNFSKQVYLCSIILHVRDEYVALEWLDSDEVAEGVLDLTESLLIYALQPRLNSAKRKRPQGRKPVSIHVQNYAGTGILDDLILEYSENDGLSFVPSQKEKFLGLKFHQY